MSLSRLSWLGSPPSCPTCTPDHHLYSVSALVFTYSFSRLVTISVERWDDDTLYFTWYDDNNDKFETEDIAKKYYDDQYTGPCVRTSYDQYMSREDADDDFWANHKLSKKGDNSMMALTNSSDQPCYGAPFFAPGEGAHNQIILYMIIYFGCVLFWFIGALLESVNVFPCLEWTGKTPNIEKANDFCKSPTGRRPHAGLAHRASCVLD